MKKPFFRTPYNYDTNKASDESAIADFGKSMTKQSFAEECDINTIVKRFNLTGQMPDTLRIPRYQDYEGIFDFHSAMNAITDANEAFYSLPAALRGRFHNDPGEFVDFCTDEKNAAEAATLGLVDRKPAPESPPQAPTPVAPGATTAAPDPTLPPTTAPAAPQQKR